MKESVETSLYHFLSKIPEFFRQRHDSLVEYNSVLNNNYIVLIEEQLRGLEYMPAVLEKIQTLLAANQVTAIGLLVGVPKVDIISTLDKVSTRRSPTDNLARSGQKLLSFAASESRSRRGLGSYEDMVQGIGREARGDKDPYASWRGGDKKTASHKDSDTAHGVTVNNEIKTNVKTPQSANNVNVTTSTNANKNAFNSSVTSKDIIKNIHEHGDLVTGKSFTVEFERDGNKAELVLNVSLGIRTTDSDSMFSLLTVDGIGQSWSERCLKADIGMLSTVKDLWFSNDLIDNYRKNRFKDKSGYYKLVSDNRNKNWLSGLFSFSRSINNASSVMIFSEDTASAAAAELGGEITEFSVRDRLFKDTLTVYLLVVDTVWDKVTIYTRGLATGTTVDASDFKKHGNKSGGDVNKIIDAYTRGSNPVI